MSLSVNGFVLPIAQLGIGFMILDKPVEHDPATAEISMSIDGRERRWNVYLPDGITPTEPKTRIAAAKRRTYSRSCQ
ncbi:MAG: hypothetical protein EXS16_19730 [Gemmataceae bacterium]|nr:hypothetical protein [Gemmataceae bacterium]